MLKYYFIIAGLLSFLINFLKLFLVNILFLLYKLKD